MQFDANSQISRSSLEGGERQLRRAERFALLLRRAKLICDSGQYPCIIRDVSSSGVRLRLFGALPRLARYCLELANGDRYPVEPVREQDDHTAFRFCAPIDVHAFLREASPFPRREIRLQLDQPAIVLLGKETFRGLVRDISQSGARLEIQAFLEVGRQIRLEIPGLPGLSGKVRWRREQEYGLVFLNYLTFDRLAQLLAKLENNANAGTRLTRLGTR